MSERRQQVLDAIQRAAEPVSVSELADRVGVHPNTVRFHLEALVGDGMVERVPDTPSGPGRPVAGPAWRAAVLAATGCWPRSCSATCPPPAMTLRRSRPPPVGHGVRILYPDQHRLEVSPVTMR